MSLTVSSARNIITPIGNQLAIFIDNQTNKLSLKDIYNQTQEVFSGEVGFDRLVLNPIGSITAPVPTTATFLFDKEDDDSSIQINVSKKRVITGDGGTGTLNYLEYSEIESSATFTGTSGQIVDKQSRADYRGEGSISQLASYKGSTDLNGDLDKDVEQNYTIQSQAFLNGTGNDTIKFIVGYYCGLNGDNGNATVEDYYAYTSNDNTSGTIEITDSYTCFASFGIKNADMIINEYIGYYHTSNQVTPATDNYFMKNVVDMPLDTVGAVISKEYSVKALNSAPSSASDTGTTGEIKFTSDAIYVCTATDTWKKADITTF